MRPVLLRLPLHVGAAGRHALLLNACRGAAVPVAQQLVAAPPAARVSPAAGWRYASDATGGDTNVDLTINTLTEDKEIRSVFEFSEEEVDELWASVDLNGDGMVTRPKAALLLKRAVVLQHSKMKMMVQEKLEKEEDIEAGLIRGIPRWMQWGIGDSIATLQEQTTMISVALEKLEPNVELIDKLFNAVDADQDGEITKAEFEELIASGAMANIELEDLRSTLETQQKGNA